MSQYWNGEILAAPNLITVCVDESRASEISGRLYHCYSREPQSFENIVQLIRYMEEFYDRQNATWQGSVTWVDKKEKQQFRSALELLKLIESALDEEEGGSHEK